MPDESPPVDRHATNAEDPGPVSAKEKLVIRDLEPGQLLELSNGLIAKVAMNPRDGYWVIVTTGEEGAEQEEMLMAHEIARVLPPDPR